jgi:putative intracellular protease/amidase
MGASSTPRKTFRVAVFIPTECQLLDQACIDVLATMSFEYLSLLKDMLPAAVLDLAPLVQICYVGSVPAGDTIPLTANQRIVCTHHYDDAAVAPGTLDAVIVPGPDPTTRFEAPVVDWLRAQAAARDTDILSVCTGIFLCGYAGLLEGRTICGPRGMQDMIKDKFGSNMVMKGTQLRWAQDGNFWSSGMCFCAFVS